MYANLFFALLILLRVVASVLMVMVSIVSVMLIQVRLKTFFASEPRYPLSVAPFAHGYMLLNYRYVSTFEDLPFIWVMDQIIIQYAFA